MSSSSCGRSGDKPLLASVTPYSIRAERTCDGIEKIGRGDQPIAPTANALERKPGGLGLTQQLRNAGARQPHLRGEVFTGMESAVRKLAQQGESERSKH